MHEDELTDDELINGYLTVCSSILNYIKCKRMGLYIPNNISLFVMVKRKKELWNEYVRRHSGEFRYDGGVVGEKMIEKNTANLIKYEVTMQVKKNFYANSPEEAEAKFWEYYQELNDDEYKIDVMECDEKNGI